MSSHGGDVRRIFANLSSSSKKRVYNALVNIRTDVIKSPQQLKKIIEKGLVPRLLCILDDADTSEVKPSIADVVLSILGNLCMEADTRTLVIHCDGVELIARHLLESSVESIQNRSCRCLANLSLSPSTCSQIIALDVAPHVAKLLRETSSKECKLTYCRAFRLLGRTATIQKRLVEAGAVLAVAKLVKDDEVEVSSCALRTTSELIKVGCCSNFARQVISAGVLEYLVTLVDSDECEQTSVVLKLLFLLTDQADARAAIGAAGGVQLFIRLLQNKGERTHINRVSLINALSQCGKEAVNRMKIRELGGLEVFLSALLDPSYRQVQDRIISGLISFLYDDVSFDILLDGGLVEVLLLHLQRCGSFTSTVEAFDYPLALGSKGSLFDLQKSPALHSDLNISSDLHTDLNTSSDLHRPSDLHTLSDPHRPSDLYTDLNTSSDPHRSSDLHTSSDLHMPSDPHSLSDLHTSSDLHTVSDPHRLSDLITDLHSSDLQTSTDLHTLSDPQRPSDLRTDLHKLSDLHRPSDLRIELYSSTLRTSEGQAKEGTDGLNFMEFDPVKDGSRFTNQSIPLVDEDGALHKYSIDSPSYEVNTTWDMEANPGQTCKLTFGYEDTIVRSPSPDMPLSPLSNDTYFSPARSSPTYSLHSDHGSVGSDDEYRPVFRAASYTGISTSYIEDEFEGALQYSSSDNDDSNVDCKDDDDNEMSCSLDKKKQCQILRDLVPAHVSPDEDRTADQKSSGKRPLSVRSPSYKLDESISKRTKTNSKRTEIMKSTEKNILILLSRISVKTNPTMHLVKRNVMCCMLDYLFYVPLAHSRCVRTLSRLFKNPHCLEQVLLFNLPYVVYKKIILDGNGVDKESYGSFSRRGLRRSRSISWQSNDSDDSFHAGFAPIHGRAQHGSSTSSRTTNALDFTHGLLASPTSPRSELEINLMVGQNPAELSVVDIGQSGLGLLKDLSFSAESAFGKGVISHILLRCPQQKPPCSLSLLFLCWGSEMQKQYLMNFRVLDFVVDFLKQDRLNPGPVFTSIVAGLSFLCKLNNVPPKLQPKDASMIFKPAADLTCVYESGLQTDVSFTVDDVILAANREILTNSCDVFMAMLDGHYSESTQTQIKIEDTSDQAMEYILHFLHGCTIDCSVLREVKVNSSVDEIDFLLDVIVLADRFLLIDLAIYVQAILSSVVFDAFYFEYVFEYIAYKNFSDLTFDCVRTLFAGTTPVTEKSQILTTILSSHCADVFVEKMKCVLVDVN